MSILAFEVCMCALAALLEIWDYDEVYNIISVEIEFPAIFFDDMFTSQITLSCETTVSPLNDNEIDFRISFDELDDEDYTIWLFHLEIRDKQINVFDFGGLIDLMAEGLSGRMLMDHWDAQGHSVFTSRAWRMLFKIRGPLLGGVKLRKSWREFILGIGLHNAEEIESVGFSAYWAESVRDSMLRLCHRLIACSIAERSQAPEKVIVTDLFYSMGMDVGSINIAYLLARLVPSCFVVFDLEPLLLSLDFIQRFSLTGFPAQSIGSSSTDVLDLPCLLVLITGTSQSRQHDKSESDSYYLSD
ncbi:hypothetical protein Tco_0601783 [Tanacetum coccineum]